MSVFTEYERADGLVEVYASTNKNMGFAIEVMDAGFTPIINAHDSISQWYNNLLPIDLKEIGYLPAEQMMLHWINLFFSNRSRGGLIPTLAQQSGRKHYNEITDDWERGPGDSRFFGVLDGAFASMVGMLFRMHEFISWFPEDPELHNNSQVWACAFTQENRGDNWYGHVVNVNSWALYNFVHTGPPLGVPDNTADRDMQLRFSVEGFPDTWWIDGASYAAVAQGFVHLSRVTGDSKWSDFAAFINNGLWNSRLNQNTYLMPDTVTPMGPLPGDQDAAPPFKYKHDTDCLYWARGLFNAYRLVGETHPELQPSATESLICDRIEDTAGEQAALRCRTLQRRQRLDGLLAGGFPDKYLGMALGLTLDWIQYGWVPEWNQFIRKIHHDGTRGDTRIYGDGKWNTLYMLTEAYRFTRDPFYLSIFDRAWEHFEALAQNHPELNGFFADFLDSGDLAPGTPVIELYQEIFLDVIVGAYLATVGAGAPRADYLAKAEKFATKIMAAHEAGTDYYSFHNGILGRALVRLARAREVLRRISISLSEENISALIFSNPSIGTIEVDLLGHSRAVVYMDDGNYRVVKHFSDGTESLPIPLVITSDADVAL